MAFPFTAKYEKRIYVVVTDNNRLEILLYTQKIIREKAADNIMLDENKVSYRGTTKPGRHALFGGVNDGQFKLVNNNGLWFLTYEVNLRRILAIPAIIAVVFCSGMMITGVNPFVIIVAFLWVGFGNWVIDWLRHEDLAENIALGIDKLYGDKDLLAIEEEKRSKELKSWI